MTAPIGYICRHSQQEKWFWSEKPWHWQHVAAYDVLVEDGTLFGYLTPSGKLYASSLEALQNGEQSWVKVYVNKEDLK